MPPLWHGVASDPRAPEIRSGGEATPGLRFEGVINTKVERNGHTAASYEYSRFLALIAAVSIPFLVTGFGDSVRCRLSH